ncbi:MAG: hypothetical protein H6R15_316 [Proteobacteria bacterium]|nr:hypothetical protein [Pseudomonadota bacterium]
MTGNGADRHVACRTSSRNSLPGLKCGTYFAGTDTSSPVFGFRPRRGGRWFRANEPKPRTSTRPPSTSVLAMASRISLTANSASGRTSCGKRRARLAISSDRVMTQFYDSRKTLSASFSVKRRIIRQPDGNSPTRPDKPSGKSTNIISQAVLWCPGRESNPYSHKPRDFKSLVSTNFTTRAGRPAFPGDPMQKRESAGHFPSSEFWSGRRVSNSRPQPWQGCALPTELLPRILGGASRSRTDLHGFAIRCITALLSRLSENVFYNLE